MTDPIERPTARVVPVSARGAVLLLLDRDPARPDDLRWGTIGGAVDPGESLVGAAVREAFEETGLRLAPDGLLGPFHRDRREFSYAGVRYRGDSTFFAVALPESAAVSFDHLEPAEVGNVLEARWLLPDELRADGRLVAPDLPDVVARAVAVVADQTHRSDDVS